MDENATTNRTEPPAPNPAGPTESGGEARTSEAPQANRPKEIGGRGGLDPVRYGDWEKDGRCIDF